MHYFASIKEDKCFGVKLHEIDLGYSDCEGDCIRIVQWDEPVQSYIELTPRMARDLVDALIAWQNPA